jgi:hypothetical protein
MDGEAQDRVVNVDRVNQAFVLVEFADGKSALYPGTLLRRMLPQAQVIVSDSNNGEEIAVDA